MDEEDTYLTLAILNHLINKDKYSDEVLGEEIRTRRIEEFHSKLAIKDLMRKLDISNLSEYIRRFVVVEPEYTDFERLVFFNPIRSLYSKYDQSIDFNKLKLERFKYNLGGVYCGHVSQVCCVCMDGSNRFFFTGGDDGMIKLWDARKAMLLRSLIGHRYSINDMCVSEDCMYMASCDYKGTLKIWSLKSFTAIWSLQMGSEIELVEFCKIGVKNEKEYSLVLVESRGVIKTIVFDEEQLISETENAAINEISGDESIRAICITEGGRFLLCGGLWPFLIVFDIFDIKDKLMVLETEGYSVLAIYASKSNFKVVASTLFSILICWEFKEEGDPSMGNFKKRRAGSTNLKGHWKRTIVRMDIPEDHFCEDICFLADDNYMVCMCTDNKIRIFHNLALKHVIETKDIGVLCAHPTEPIFVVRGEDLKIMNVEGKVYYEESLKWKVIDAQFTPNGEYFIGSDEAGNARIYASFPFKAVYDEAPREQFFTTDFTHITLLYQPVVEGEEYFLECDMSCTYNSNKKKNDGWYKIEYNPSQGMSYKRHEGRSLEVENIALLHLTNDFLSVMKFKKKYFVINEPVEEEIPAIPEMSSREQSSHDESEDASESDDPVINITRGTVEMSRPRRNRRASRRKKRDNDEETSTDLEETTPPLVTHRYRGRRRQHEEEDSSEFGRGYISQATHRVGNRRRENEPRFVAFEPAVSPVMRRAAIEAQIAIEAKDVPSTTINDPVALDIEELSTRKRRKPQEERRKSTPIFGLVDQEMSEYSNAWITSSSPYSSYLPQKNDKVFFIYERYEDFIKIEQRKEFINEEIPKRDGYYRVENVNYVKYTPNYVELDLMETDDSGLDLGNKYSLRYYDYFPVNRMFVLYECCLLSKKYKFRTNEKIKLVYDGKLYEARITKTRGDSLFIKYEDLSTDVIRKYDVYFDAERKPLERKDMVIEVLKENMRGTGYCMIL